MLLKSAEIIWRIWVWICLPFTVIAVLCRMAGLTDMGWLWLTAPAWGPAGLFIILLSIAITSRSSRRWLALRLNGLRRS